jgi:hypothetical protein
VVSSVWAGDGRRLHDDRSGRRDIASCCNESYGKEIMGTTPPPYVLGSRPRTQLIVSTLFHYSYTHSQPLS